MISNSPVNKMITIGCKKCKNSSTVSIAQSLRLLAVMYRGGLCDQCRAKKMKKSKS